MYCLPKHRRVLKVMFGPHDWVCLFWAAYSKRRLKTDSSEGIDRGLGAGTSVDYLYKLLRNNKRSCLLLAWALPLRVRYGYRLTWRSDTWRTDRCVGEIRSPDIKPATEDDVRRNAPGLRVWETAQRLLFKYADIYKTKTFTLSKLCVTVQFSSVQKCLFIVG